MKRALIAAALAAALAPQAGGAGAEGIPDWVRSVAGYWADGDVGDAEFAAAVEFLAREGVISVAGPAAGPGRPLEGADLVIGFIPVEKAEAVSHRAEALAGYLEAETGAEVEVVVPTGYEAIIEGMRFGHVDAAFMDAGPAWIASDRAGAEVVLAEVVDGKIGYQATMWVAAGDDSIGGIGDAVGKRVAFTSITGSSGFVVPMGALIAGGHAEVPGGDIVALERALGETFESHTFAGGYKPALELLLQGRADAAFGSDLAPQKYLEPEERALLRPAAELGAVPSHAFVVAPGMGPAEREALTDALVGLNYGEHNRILEELYGAQALLPTDTETHIGGFGSAIGAVAGLDRLILDKHDRAR